MRQQGMGYIGAIMMMVIAGLIIYIIISPNVLQGIKEGIVGVGSTSIRDISQNPQAYENKEVAVVGYPSIFWLSFGVMDDSGYFILFYPPVKESDVHIWISVEINAGYKCKVTGKIIRVKEMKMFDWAISSGIIVLPGDPLENDNGAWTKTGWRLQVTEISRI